MLTGGFSINITYIISAYTIQKKKKMLVVLMQPKEDLVKERKECWELMDGSARYNYFVKIL